MSATVSFRVTLSSSRQASLVSERNTTRAGGQPAMLTRGWMEIDLDALVRNARALRDRARVPLLPMIKADAYGLGAIEVARALEQLDPRAYGVATVTEGEELRE